VWDPAERVAGVSLSVSDFRIDHVFDALCNFLGLKSCHGILLDYDVARPVVECLCSFLNGFYELFGFFADALQVFVGKLARWGKTLW